MPTCPVCDHNIDADEVAFEHHVNAHFDEPETSVAGARRLSSSGASGSGSDSVEYIGSKAPVKPPCFVCGKSLNHLDDAATNAHVAACLDGDDLDAPVVQRDESELHAVDDPDNYVDSGEEDFPDFGEEGLGHEGVSPGKTGARKHRQNGVWDATAFSNRSGKAKHRDKWWDPVTGRLDAGSVPPNFSPGIIPVIRKLIAHDSKGSRGVTVRQAVHIKGAWGFDGTWGCGYRNALMAIAALRLAGCEGAWEKTDPGVRVIQQWIEDAWRAGFDPYGKQQLKGKLVGTSKWIGTSDLYAMFSYLGIDTRLVDFRKPEDRDYPNSQPTHQVLGLWVKRYFDEAAEHDGSIPGLRITSYLPLILQHAGHSRTIVGYEERKGEITLLILDPAKTVPKDVRSAGLEAAREARAAKARPPAGPGVGDPSASSPESGDGDDGSVLEGAAAAAPSESDEVTADGWVRRKVVSKVAKASAKVHATGSGLSVFRVNLSRWSGHNQYQVLAFSGGRISAAESGKRKHPTSTAVDAVDME